MNNKYLNSIGAIGLTIIATSNIVPVRATPPVGVSVVQLAPVAQFDEIHANAMVEAWGAKIKTKGVSDLHIVEVTIQPGGTIGWHSHLGPSFVIVKSGTATFYEGDDPTCTPHVVTAGHGYVDSGDGHVGRNETGQPASDISVILAPVGGAFRAELPAPGPFCNF